MGLWALAGLFVVGLLWGSWTAISLWRSWGSIETLDRFEPDVAASLIENTPVDERPPPPPLVPIDDEPIDDDPIATTTAPPTATSGAPDVPPASTTEPPPPDITGEQIPYNPDFISSPAVPDDAFDAYLLIGSDARADRGGQRADVIILALLPTDGSAPILVSLPRDLWVDIPCWERPNRVNAALNGCGDAASGPELLALTVAGFTRIQADHIALFNFDDFERMIDAFGGIEICVEHDVREKRLRLPAGCSKADGATSLLWIRSRRTEELVDGEWRRMSGVNDLTRNERQQDVLIEMLKNVKSLETLTSLASIVDSIADAVTIDDGLTLGGAMGLAWDMRDLAPNKIRRIKIPVRHFRTDSGAQVLLAKEPFADLLAEVWPGSE